MNLLFDISEENFAKPLVVDNQEFLPGESGLIKLIVGRLPSDTQITITAHVIRSINPGPTALILGGVHGDEINGIEIVRGLIEDNNLQNISKGNIILIPLLNVFGFINFSRDVPDGKDINKSFPGTMRGSLAARVARLVTKKILPLIDFAIDCHTGGASRYNYPQIRFSPKDEKARELAFAFKAPFIIQKGLITKSFRKVAKVSGIPVIVYEGGESIRLDGLSIDAGKSGILRTLRACNMLNDESEISNESSVHVKRTSWVRAPQSGIFIWSKSSGSFIKKNESLGIINDPYGNKKREVPHLPFP